MPAGIHKKQKACLSPRPTRPRIWYNCDNPSFCALLIIIVFAFGTSNPDSIIVVQIKISTPPSKKDKIVFSSCLLGI